MANAWENPSMIAAEALTHLEDALVITNLAATDKTAEFLQRPNGYAVGDTVKIKTRPEYRVDEFTTAISKQDIRQSVRQMSIEKLYDVSVEITAKEKVLSIDSFSEDVIKPAIYALAEKIDQYVGTKLLKAAGLYASDSLFTSQADMAAARKAATIQQLGMDRLCLVDLDLEATLLSQPYFATWEKRGDAGATAFNMGSMGRAMNLNFYSSINFPDDTHAAAGSGTALTNNNSGANNKIGDKVLVFDGGSANGINAGDRISVAGCRRPLIAAETIADLSADTEIALVDPITEIVDDNAAISVIGSGQSSLAAHGIIMDKNCVAFAMPMLDPPSDKPSSVQSSNGFSIRVVQGYDIDSKKETMSLDCLVGAEMYDPRRATLLREY